VPAGQPIDSEVDDRSLQERLDGILDLAWADTTGAWELGRDGAWTRVPQTDGPVSLQDELMVQAASS